MDEIDKITTLLCKAEDEIAQWKRVVVAHVEEITMLKDELAKLSISAFASLDSSRKCVDSAE